MIQKQLNISHWLFGVTRFENIDYVEVGLQYKQHCKQQIDIPKPREYLILSKNRESTHREDCAHIIIPLPSMYQTLTNTTVHVFVFAF